jgi:hypothetical protein
MAVKFMDPRPPVGVDADVARPQPWTGEGNRAVFGLLANGFPDSAAFLAGVAGSVARRFPAAGFRTVEKARPQDPLTDEQLNVLTAECDLVIAAYGH